MHIFAVFLIRLLNLLIWIIIIQCLMSWFPSVRMSKAYDMLSMITEPLVGPIRDVLFRFIDVPIDFSPIIAIFIIELLQRVVISLAW